MKTKKPIVKKGINYAELVAFTLLFLFAGVFFIAGRITKQPEEIRPDYVNLYYNGIHYIVFYNGNSVTTINYTLDSLKTNAINSFK